MHSRVDEHRRVGVTVVLQVKGKPMRPDRFVDVEEIDDKRAMPAHNEAVAAVGHQRQWTSNIIAIPTYLLRSPHQIRHLLRIGRLAQIEDSEAFLSDDNRPRANDGDSAIASADLTGQDARVADLDELLHVAWVGNVQHAHAMPSL